MIETHAFGNFVPNNAKYLILGSFTAKQAVKNNIHYDDSYDWFYSNNRNQFWPILEAVYKLQLKDKSSKQKLFSELGIAMADIILQCERIKGNNLDINLTNFVYNLDAINDILGKNNIQTIFFTSRYVEIKFKRIFKKVISDHPNILLITLPSPSPRFAQMSKDNKIAKYKELLPQIN